MPRPEILFALGALLVAGCAGSRAPVGHPGHAPREPAREAGQDPGPPRELPPAASEAFAAGPGSVAPVLQEAEYRRRFAESYLAESEVEPRLTSAERDQIQEILGLVAAERLPEALELLGKRSAASGNAVFDFTTGNIHFQREELGPAEEAFGRAVAKFPRFRRAWRHLGLVRLRRGAWASAVAALSRTVELGGGDAVTAGLLGFAHASAGNPLAAETAYRQAILLDPKTLDWKLGLGRSLFQQARYPEAVSLFDGLLAEHPDRAELWLAQGEAYARMQRPVQAAQNFEVADRLGAASKDCLENLGDIYANEGLFDLAVGAYLRALAKDLAASPKRALRAARFLASRALPVETRALLDGIQAACGDRLAASASKEILMLRARVAAAEQAGEEEVRLLEEIVALDPQDGEALLQLGQLRARTGDAESAILLFERAAALEAFESDAKVRHAQLLVGQGRYAQALPLLRRAQTLKPRDSLRDYLDQVERAAAQPR
jgi:tetratricopeptide (TPR) repeat protein